MSDDDRDPTRQQQQQASVRPDAGRNGDAPAYTVDLEAEEWSDGDWDPADEATDVIVTFADGARWVATFVAYAHVPTLVARNRESGACLAGRYLWATDLVLAADVRRATVEAVVADLLTDGGFDSAFTPLEDDADDDDAVEEADGEGETDEDGPSS